MTPDLSPVVPPDATPPAVPPAASAVPRGRLLCVDDEPNILSALRRLFRGHPWDVTIASSGAQALELMAQQPFDVVLSDMRMPEMDGATLLQKVYEAWPDTTRILLTGYADMQSTIAAINEGRVHRFISKPWNDVELPLVIAQAMEHRFLLLERARLEALTREQNERLTHLNAELEQRVQARTQDLAQANEKLKANWLATVSMFTSLMELRDGSMAGHGRRVAASARRIAQAMGLSATECQDVFLAGLLHDLGKMGLPDAVLRKPIRLLNADDLVHYRKHPARAEEALMPLSEFQGAARLIRAHHERFDGRGFPHGLSGEGIPLGARILALANEVDNLLQGQLSEQPVTLEQVMARTQSLKGTRYDPNVVDAWARLESGGATPEANPMVALLELQPGDVLVNDLVNDEGLLLLAADHALDTRLVQHIQRYFGARVRTIKVAIRPRKGA